MRSILILVFTVLNFVGFSQTIFTENIGTGTTATLLISNNTFQNSSLVFTGTADTRTTTPSTGYTGSSGGRNVFFTNTVGKNFIISGINTSALNSPTLSFGHFKSNNASSNELLVDVSSDGITYTSLSYSRTTGAGTSNWILITTTGTIPSTNNLSIRFTNNISTANFRIDDIKLTYTSTLPITLTSYTGQKEKDYNLLEWSTATELNNDYFLLESSEDCIVWNTISKTKGAGNSIESNYYSYQDYFYNSINYYRLSQVDYDGSSEMFGIIYIENKKISKKIISVIDLNGQQVPIDTKGLLIFIYDDGSTIRVFKH